MFYIFYVLPLLGAGAWFSYLIYDDYRKGVKSTKGYYIFAVLLTVLPVVNILILLFAIFRTKVENFIQKHL